MDAVQEDIWRFVKDSFSALDTVLQFERSLNEKFPSDRKYAIENRGATTVKVYSQEYSAEFHRLLDGQVERRLRAAILDVGSFWTTAWINAGSPDLLLTKKNQISDSLRMEIVNETENKEVISGIREE